MFHQTQSPSRFVWDLHASLSEGSVSWGSFLYVADFNSRVGCSIEEYQSTTWKSVRHDRSAWKIGLKKLTWARTSWCTLSLSLFWRDLFHRSSVSVLLISQTLASLAIFPSDKSWRVCSTFLATFSTASLLKIPSLKPNETERPPPSPFSLSGRPHTSIDKGTLEIEGLWHQAKSSIGSGSGFEVEEGSKENLPRLERAKDRV